MRLALCVPLVILVLLLPLAGIAGCSGDTGGTAADETEALGAHTEPVHWTPLRGPLTPLAPGDFRARVEAAPGRVLLVNLWSTWCRPCMEEMPMLVGLAERYAARGVGAMFISMDLPANEPAARRFMIDSGAPSPSYLRAGRDGEFIEAVHPDWSGTLPATILLDAERRARHLWTGEVDPSALESAIQALLQDRRE